MTMSETKSVAVKEKDVDPESNILAKEVTPNSKSGEGCHGGAARMQEAAKAAGKSEVLEQYAKEKSLKQNHKTEERSNKET